MTFYPQDGGIGGGTPRDDTWYNPPWAAPKRSTAQRIAGLLSAALQGAAGQQSAYAQMVAGERQNEQQGEQQNLLMQLKIQAEEQQRARTPHYFESNNGSQFQVLPGQAPTEIFHDPNPKTEWITVNDPVTGLRIIPKPTGAPAMSAPLPDLPQGYTVRPKGGAASGPQTFPGAFDALIQQESGGRAGAVGPQTRYGRALGMTQMLPSTAQGVAGKLGVPYRADLLAGKTPAAANYQRSLGEAYFNEGLQATGNLRDALHYYHGGPNRKMWGPKTRAYADAVLSRMGG